MRQARSAADRAAIPEVALMAVADILYFGLLAGVMLASTLVLLGQFLRQDLAGGHTTTRWPRRRASRPRPSPAASRPHDAHRGRPAAPHALAR
jgi:hypothetical protein